MTEHFPDLADGLDAIERKVATLETVVDALKGRHELAGLLIDHLVEISDQSEVVAVETAVDGVRAGRVSRRNAADRLGVHSHTLQRIIDDRAKHDGEKSV